MRRAPKNANRRSRRDAEPLGGSVDEGGTVAVRPRSRNESETVPATVAAAAIEAWFPKQARDLPWRRRRTPYRVLVSEAMLQQTQVSRIAERFPRFLRRFPSIRALAAAPLDEVLAEWEGLGYYRRARLLHAAAIEVVASHGGRIPSDPKGIRSLPGVGRYTAGAVASLAFGLREPIVDGNVIRVVLRLDGRPLASDDPAAIDWSWHRARELVEAARDPAVLNEGLMELGATVCTPANPRCAECPLAEHCRAKASAQASSIPRPKRAAVRREVHHHAISIRGSKPGSLLLRQRPAKGLWAGLWELPTIESPTALPEVAIAASLGIPEASLRTLGRFSHKTTHRDVTFHVFEVEHAASKLARRSDLVEGTRECSDAARRELAMGVPQRRTLALAEHA
jgi:A/G-specific adenine glycosylase